MYPEELVKPMREDLASAGFEELHTSEAVNDALKKDGLLILIFNTTNQKIWEKLKIFPEGPFKPRIYPILK